MELNNYLEPFIKGLDPDVVVCILTALFGLIAWLVKGLIDVPLTSSRDTFNRYFERRIETLTEIKIRLNFIMHFPRIQESKEFKEELQKILLRDGKLAYVNEDTLSALTLISITPETDESLLLKTYQEVSSDLAIQIGKISREISFYNKFYDVSPARRIASLFALSLINIILLMVIVALVVYTARLILTGYYYQLSILLIVLVLCIVIYYRFISR